MYNVWLVIRTNIQIYGWSFSFYVNQFWFAWPITQSYIELGLATLLQWCGSRRVNRCRQSASALYALTGLQPIRPMILLSFTEMKKRRVHHKSKQSTRGRSLEFASRFVCVHPSLFSCQVLSNPKGTDYVFSLFQQLKNIARFKWELYFTI